MIFIGRGRVDNNEINSLGKSTLINVIDHSLGLSYRRNNPFNTDWNTADRVMSYKNPKDSLLEWFSEIDMMGLNISGA